jgi:hypothetical protein
MTNLYQVKTEEVGQVWPLFMVFPYDSILDAIIHGYHGKIYTDNIQSPQFVMAIFADIIYLSGDVSDALLELIINEIPLYGEIHCNNTWVKRLESKGLKLKSFTRYAMNHEKIKPLEIKKLMANKDSSVKVTKIDEAIYHALLSQSWSKSLVENFENFNDFNHHAFGYVVKKNDLIVSGTSSFARYNDGLEIEIVTHEDYRNNGYATLSAAYFIHACLESSLVPHWDAANLKSKQLALKLGYTLSRSYEVYEVTSK